MLNEPTLEELCQLPTVEASLQERPEHRIARMHFFSTDSQWFIVAYEPRPDLLFSYTIHSGFGSRGAPYQFMQWEYSYFGMMCMERGANGAPFVRNENWVPQPVYEIPCVRHYRKMLR